MSSSTQIRRLVERLEVRGRGIRYPLELKERLIAETQSRRAAGKTLEVIGEELGVPWKTLSRWCTEEQKSESGFRAVEIVATPSAKLVVHGPAGLRIEGFDLDGVVELLRRLG